MPTISWAMIVRDAEDSLEACLESIKPHVDQLIIVLGGKSTDKTEEIARRFTDEVHDFEWVDDFAAARNYAFSFATGDWLGWCDHDDVVEHGEKLHDIVAETDAVGAACIHLTYEYRHDKKDRPTVLQTRERLMKRAAGWLWKGAVHEYCASETPHTVTYSDDVLIKHTSNESHVDAYLPILLKMEAEEPENERTLGILADTYLARREYKLGLAYAERAIAATTNLDICWTLATEMARTYIVLKKWELAEHWCHIAVGMHPEYSLAYLLLAHIAWFGYQDSDRGMLYLGDADAPGRFEAPLVVHRQPEDYTVNRWDVEHRLYADQGKWEIAYQIVELAISHIGEPDVEPQRPTKSRAWEYFAWYYIERTACEKSIAGVTALVDHLCRRGDTLRARKLLEETLPLSIRNDRRILALYERIKQFTAHVQGDPEAYRRFYEENHYDAEHAENCLNGVIYEPYRMNVVLKRLQARGAKRVLDVGCGAGGADFFLGRNGIHVVGLDINQFAIKEAKRLATENFGTLAEDGEKALFKPEFHLGSLDTLGPEELGTFDAVLTMEVIEHLPPASVPFYLSSAEDLLNPGGAVMFTCPGMAVGDIPGVFAEFPRDHVQEFSRQDLERLITRSPGRRLKRPINLYQVFDPAVSVPGFASWFGEYEWYPEDKEFAPEWDQPVVIYCGPGLEEWNADTPDTKGLGGSETWAAKTAASLRRRGHPVIVYATVDEVRDGVIYRQYEQFNPEAPFAGAPAWLHIQSRQLEALDVRPNAEHVVFVAHDVDYGAVLTAERLANIDTYAVLSDWQKWHTSAVYSQADFDTDLSYKLRVIANGIEPSFFEGEAPERVAHSFVWSSSPDRGLDRLLEWWPEIREMWEDASLEIYYGWDNVDALTQVPYPSTRAWLPAFKARVEALAEQEGVTWRGRIGQRELATEMQKASFWLYPSVTAFGEPWHETFCITALEAQAGGCIPIIPQSGALPERFYYGFMSQDEELELPDVLEALQSWDERRHIQDVQREQGMRDVLANTWERATDLLLACVEVPDAVEAG